MFDAMAAEGESAAAPPRNGTSADPVVQRESDFRAALDHAYAYLQSTDARRPMRPQLESASQAAGRLAMRSAALRTAMGSLADRPDFASLAPSLETVFESLANTARSIALAIVSRQPAHLVTCEVRLRRTAGLLAALRERIASRGTALPGGEEDIGRKPDATRGTAL